MPITTPEQKVLKTRTFGGDAIEIVLQGAQRRCQRSPQIGRTDLRQIKRSLPVVLTNSAQGYGIGKPIRKVQIKRLDFAKFQFGYGCGSFCFRCSTYL